MFHTQIRIAEFWMQSKNKPRPTVAEARHIERLKETPCACCGDEGQEIHEFEQGQWFTSVHLCIPCHRGPDGWHGTRRRWTLRKMDMLKAINETYRQLAGERT